MSNNHSKPSQPSYPLSTAGRSMKTHVPTINQSQTLQNVTDLLYGELFATINYIYVVTKDHKLSGVISIKDVFRHPGEVQIKEVMRAELITVRAHTPQSQVASLALKHNLKAIPVVNKENKLLGIIDSDTMLKIVEQEAAKQTLSLSGIVSHSHEEGQDSVFTAVKHRLPWLLLGLLGGIATASVIAQFEEALSESIILAAFIPLVVYMSSAVGNQILVLLIRGYSKNPKLSAFKFFFNQLPIVLVISTVSTVLLFLAGSVFMPEGNTNVALSIAMFLTITTSIFPGVVIPAIFKNLGVDPADASGPITTTIQDLLSVFIYLIVVSSLV